MAELQKLVDNIQRFITFVKSKESYYEDLTQKFTESIRVIDDKSQTYHYSKKASLDLEIIQEFPDVKEKLLEKLRLIIEKDIEDMSATLNKIKMFVTELFTHFIRIERLSATISWNDYTQFMSPVVKTVEWCERCWRLYNLMYVNMSTAMTRYSFGEDRNTEFFKKAIASFNTDKTSVYRSPELAVFEMLKTDIETRSKVSVKSV